MRFLPVRLLGLLLACGATHELAEASPAATGSRLSSIPAAFQARWRPDQNQCSDMTEYGLDLDARKVSYYGRSGPAKSIRQTGPRSIVITYTAREAEFGSSQDHTVSYEISADGHTLVETEQDGYRMRRIRCGNGSPQTAASRPAPIVIDSLIGDWEDGGPACASIRRGRTATSIVFRAWYCEAGEQSGTAITLERLGDRVFKHRATDLDVVVHSGSMMQASAGPRSRKQFGDGLYVTEPGRIYNKKVAAGKAAYPAQLPQLRAGAYVSFPTRCAQASNATLEWWNGQFFSGGRKHPAYPRAVGAARPNGSQPFVADVKGWEDSKTYRVNFLVLSQSMYERDGLRYFHCSDARLPPMWRGETPPQTAVPSADAGLAKDTRVAPVTPREFREWQGGGDSYGYLCTVRMGSGSLALRSTPAGGQVGSIPNGDTFLLMDVRVTADGETWYRADPLKRRGAGWVSSRFVTCNAEHFD